MFVMQDVEHALPFDPEDQANGNSRRRGRSQRFRSSHRFLTKKVSRGKQRDRCFLPPFGHDGEFRPAILEIKHGISQASLTKDGLPCRLTVDTSSRSFGRKKRWYIKRPAGYAMHRIDLILQMVRPPRSPSMLRAAEASFDSVPQRIISHT